MKMLEAYMQKWLEMAIQFAPKLLLAILVLFVGLKAIKFLTNALANVMKKRGLDVTLRTFLTSMTNWALKVMLALSVASMIGIETTSFVAVLGAAGLAIGLALQGSLSNFAGGVLLLLFRPYKVGDLIEAQGHLGHVSEIQIFVTILVTLDSKQVIIPNGSISNGNITNYTALGQIRVDLEMGIAYNADISHAKRVLTEVMGNHPQVMKSPAPFVGVLSHGDSAVKLAVRPHCDPEVYWDVYFDIYEQCKIALDQAGITIPFPQMDVHIRTQA